MLSPPGGQIDEAGGKAWPCCHATWPGRYLRSSPVVSGGNSKRQQDDSAHRRWIIQQGRIGPSTPHTNRGSWFFDAQPRLLASLQTGRCQGYTHKCHWRECDTGSLDHRRRVRTWNLTGRHDSFRQSHEGTLIIYCGLPRTTLVIGRNYACLLARSVAFVKPLTCHCIHRHRDRTLPKAVHLYPQGYGLSQTRSALNHAPEMAAFQL